MNLIKILTMLIVLAIAVGCAGQHCISVGGEYEGIDGNIEYCWNSGKAAETGVPALTDSDGTTFFGFDEEHIQAILDKLKEKTEEVIGTKSLETKPEKPPDQKHPVRELLELLEDKENKENKENKP